MNRKERRASGERGPKHPTVELAYLHPGDVSAAFMASVIRVRDYELVRTQQLIGVRERRSRSGSIAKARNEVTNVFLQGDAEWLWFVDADMGFGRDALHKLLSAADPVERPLVGGLCFAHRTEGFDEETNAEFFGMIPTVSVWKRRESDNQIVAFNTVVDYPRDAVCKADSTGAACILIHRGVLERVREAYGDNWFTQLPHPERDETFGEDTSFYIRCADLGIPLHIDTRVRTSHDKGGIFLTQATWDQQQELRAHLQALRESVGELADEERLSLDGLSGLGDSRLDHLAVAAHQLGEPV